MYSFPVEIISYQIQPGDSCWLLAQKCQTTVEAIMSLNPGVNPYYLFVGQMVYLPLVKQYVAAASFEQPQHPACLSKAEVDLKNLVRTLWEQHVAWTRMVIISMAEDLKDVELVTNRLLRNAEDLAAVFRIYYGEEMSTKFAQLVRDHLVIAAQLVKAAKAGDTKATEQAEKQWFANADNIVAFLHQLNPYWAEEAMRAMWYNHLRLTKDEAVSRLTKDYATDIDKFGQIEQLALEMADRFSEGIIHQFPNMFS